MYPYGECECDDQGCQCDWNPGPAAYTVVRDGKTMKVCTRCDLTSDKPTRKLLVTEDTDPVVFAEYDLLGALHLANEVRKETT